MIMRNWLPVAAFLLLSSFTMSAQSKSHKLGLSFGGGPQDYRGDLGNGFKVNSYDSWRGAVVLQAGYYLNPSFDAGLFGSLGDLGFCQTFDVSNLPVESEDQCPGCEGRVGLGNLSSRLAAAGLSLKYKFANGYLLKEHSRVQPYVYAGAAFNHLTDRMKMNCVKTGNYLSVNAGLGVRFKITERINIGYNMGIGYFTQDDMDFMSHGGSNDYYMQNALLLGIDLF